MRTRESALVLVSLFLVASSFSKSAETSSVTFSVVTSFGAPLPGGQFRIDGQLVHEVITVKGRTTVTLPYGTYRLSSEPTAYYWGSDRIIDLIVPRTFVLIALAEKEAWAIFGEGAPNPYRVSGTVVLSHPRSNKLFARLRGLYLPNSAEAEVDGKGHFDLAVGLQGSYSVEIIDGESIVSAKTIRLDESKERPARVDVTVP